MCGIFGYAGNSNKDELLHKFISVLAAESEERGVDSTGFSARFDSGYIVTDKMPFRASIFTEMSHKFARMVNKMPSTFIGHTRLGTGSSPIVNNNNHPFIGKDYDMVHNGVIPSWRDIAKEHKLDMTSETDSEVILRLFEQKHSKTKRIDTTIEWLLETVWGNMAVALLEKKRPLIWLFRNENPIHVFIINESVFGGPIHIFCSNKQIFDRTWKAVFNDAPESLVESLLLEDNQLFRLSPTPRRINSRNERFIVYSLNVRRKFRVSKQYDGVVAGANDVTGRYRTSYHPERFYSQIVDVNDVSKGCAFSKEDQKKIGKILNNRDGDEKLLLDGMHVKEYASLKTFVLSVLKEERKAEKKIGNRYAIERAGYRSPVL